MMNEMIIKEMSKDLGISEKQVQTVLSLLSDGNTIPFIARYRKEASSFECCLTIFLFFDVTVSGNSR